MATYFVFALFFFFLFSFIFLVVNFLDPQLHEIEDFFGMILATGIAAIAWVPVIALAIIFTFAWLTAQMIKKYRNKS